MRNYLILISLLAVGCSDGIFEGSDSPGAQPHEPFITSVTLSPDSASQMAGIGAVLVTAEISFRDAGWDVRTMRARMPNGAMLEFDEFNSAETGTITEQFMVPTSEIGVFTLDFWLVDSAGDVSLRHSADFDVCWTRRLGELPYALNDVTWDGKVFVAVGDNGGVLTSTDGINWVARTAATEADLFKVAAHGADVFVIGEGVLLLSSDHGESWLKKPAFDSFDPHAVAVDDSLVVVVGTIPGPDTFFMPTIMISYDRGDTWQAADLVRDFLYRFTDLIYRNGLFIATVRELSFGAGGDAIVHVSADGKVWHEVVVLVEGDGLEEITHDGSQFIATNIIGSVFTSFDGYNWTGIRTVTYSPGSDIAYRSVTSDGSTLLVAGVAYGDACGLLGCDPNSEVPVGIASTDEGISWAPFNIEGRCGSNAMAFGAGRFVSVGSCADEGAIHTIE